jgi:L-threonylcarbamoyladenylate synthase
MHADPGVIRPKRPSPRRASCPHLSWLIGLPRWGHACSPPTPCLPWPLSRATPQEIWRLKERPAHKPLILMGADLAQLVDHLVGFDWREEWLQEATRRWPGAYTLVLPASFPCPITEALHPGGSSLGLRVPACPMTQALLRLTGPLATTSANRSGQAAATTAGLAGACFPHVPLLGPLPWPVGSGVASTVMAWRSPGQWDVLRRGAGMGPEVVSP